jgi:lipopolysaccharide transport system ATP-binding protein
MTDIAIKVENLSKRYRIGLEEDLPDTLVGALIQAVKRPFRNWRRLRRLTNFDDGNGRPTTDDRRSTRNDPSSSIVQAGELHPRPSSSGVRADVDHDTLWALRDISFEVNRGEVVGIIGRNGAGKSTLLKILARITHPTSGRALINGRVGSLLEVGTGFHPELTGRENIYMNGTLLGMTKDEMDRKFDEIVDFSGVEKFIDTPVKRYSSGMRVRLAFSVAAHLDPEILLVDEVLAVGDSEFQNKCLGKMGDISKQGRTILLVSHNMTSIVKMCNFVIWLEEGCVHEINDAGVAVQSYLASGLSATTGQVCFDNPDDAKIAFISSVELRNGNDEIASEFDVLSPINVEIAFLCRRQMVRFRIDVIVTRLDGVCVFSTTSHDYRSIPENLGPGNYVSRLLIPAQFLAAGDYYLTVALDEVNIKNHDLHESALRFKVIGNPFQVPRDRGLLVYPFDWELLV